MKEKIIDFSNGVFTYEQARLQIEPDMLLLEMEEGQPLGGSFVVSSCDERRVKGILYHDIDGFTLQSRSFFGRASRIEFTFHPKRLRAGESLEKSIWLETNAGEYELPVKIQIRDHDRKEEPEEEPLSSPDQPDVPELVSLRKGKGRSEKQKKMRAQEWALVQIVMWVERERRRGCTAEEATAGLRTLVDELLEQNGESPDYPLLNAWVMLREDRAEEAGWILRKYERTRLFQQRDMRTRAAFLYVNSLFRNDENVTASAVSQLQKLYQKQPENWLVTWFLLELDKKLSDRSRTRYKVLERQFRAGTRNRLFYQEAWNLLKDDMALFTRMDAFTVQVFAWASAHGLLTPEAAQAVAAQSARLKRWSPLAARLLKACYQVSPSRETAGAVCGIYIRGHRTDGEAFVWYQKGVELDAKITNLYEYFMYALPEDYPQLLPRQVILYFTYHNTLTNRQKTDFYYNLVKYGAIDQEDCAEHRRQLQEFLLKQLRERRVNESLAWLYGKCLLVETLEEDLLEALADLLFVRRLTCQEKRIRQVEVRYEQLEQTFTVPLSGGAAYVPVFTPKAEIALIDENGRRYRKTVPYEMKRLMIEPKFLQECTRRLKHHLGLNLYLLDGRGSHKLNHENVEIAYRLLDDRHISDSYRQQLQIELLDYERRHHRTEKLDERLCIQDIHALSRKNQAAYIEYLILLGRDEEAFDLLEETGCTLVDPRILLRLLQRLLADGRMKEESLRPYARQVFEQGVYTERIVGLLAKRCEGSTGQLLALWRAGVQFGLTLPELEEQLVVQALFTERYIQEVFPVFSSMDDRGADPVVCVAWINYMSWLDFVKGIEAPEGFFPIVEHHLAWEDHLGETAGLYYLKQLSVLLLLSDLQRRLVNRLASELGAKVRRFAFMQNLSPYLDEREGPDDQVIVEYRCDPAHKVVLHYVLEYHGKKVFDYVTEQLFPVCGGVFTRSFILFYGERLTWFFTEEDAQGKSISTVSHTAENREENVEGDGRYERLCRIQRALDYGHDRSLRRMMTEYQALTEITDEQFDRK